MNHKTIVGVLIAVLLIGGGIFAFTSSDDSASDTNTNASVTQNEGGTVAASDLRVGLNNALREHVNLAGVALRNVFTESPDAGAAVAALDNNSIEVANLVGVAYGDEAEESFLTVWRQHIDFFANYTVAAREGDKAGMDQALEDLAGYGEAASNFFEGANPEFLPKTAVKPLLEEHRDLVIDTLNLIGAGDFDAAYVKLGEAADQAGDIANALAGGIAAQMPEKFTGDVNAGGVDLRVALNNALREHVNLAGVALRNLYTDSPDTDAAVAALDNNSVEVAGLVGSVYGDKAQSDFLTVWRQHIDFFANYTVAAQKDDQAGMDQALEDLAGYGEAASTFFETANPDNLPKAAVKPLLEEHRDAVIATLNALDSGDFDATYVELGKAADQVNKIADALAGGIEAQFPDKF